MKHKQMLRIFAAGLGSILARSESVSWPGWNSLRNTVSPRGFVFVCPTECLRRESGHGRQSKKMGLTWHLCCNGQRDRQFYCLAWNVWRKPQRNPSHDPYTANQPFPAVPGHTLWLMPHLLWVHMKLLVARRPASMLSAQDMVDSRRGNTAH